MKICFLTHNLRQDNGAGVFSRRIITGLQQTLGAEIAALTTVPSGESYEFPLLSLSKLRLIAHLPQIRRIIRSCDTVHAMDAFPYGFVAALTSLGMPKKIIVTAIGSGSILPLYQRRLAWILRWTYRRASAITAISTFTKAEILKKIPHLAITVINPGVDAEEFTKHETPNPEDDAVRKYKPYILGVGQLRWRKGYHFSIPAFAEVKKEFPDLSYVIVGKKYTDIYYRRLQGLIQELGLQDSVHILEDVDTRQKLADIYKGAELFCLFSQNVNHDVEGFGLVFLEAAAAGLPVVGSKNCGIDDAVQDGRNGILIPTRNPDDFAKKIIAILGDLKRKKIMAEASHAFVRTMTWERQIEKYLALYRGFASRSR